MEALKQCIHLEIVEAERDKLKTDDDFSLPVSIPFFEKVKHLSKNKMIQQGVKVKGFDQEVEIIKIA